MDFKKKAKQLKKDIPVLFIALQKKETPLLAKVLAGVTLAYALSPIDLIPDFIPILGYLDDIILLPILIALTVKAIPNNIFEQCRIEAEGLWTNGKPKRWYFALPIIVIYVFLIYLLVSYLFRMISKLL